MKLDLEIDAYEAAILTRTLKDIRAEKEPIVVLVLTLAELDEVEDAVDNHAYADRYDRNEEQQQGATVRAHLKLERAFHRFDDEDPDLLEMKDRSP